MLHVTVQYNNYVACCMLHNTIVMFYVTVQFNSYVTSNSTMQWYVLCNSKTQ